MIQFTDTHTHLYLEQFDEDRDQVVKSAIEQGVHRFLLPNIDASHTASIWRMVEAYPDHCYPMTGIHPCSVTGDNEAELAHVAEELATGKYIAVGEIGMDLYWDKTFVKEQESVFRQQIAWAKEYKLPIVIHVRDAFDEALDIVESENDDALRGVFHCFTGSAAQAERILGFGDFYIGLGGVLTFKNSGLADEIKDVPMQRIVLETDSPYLTPAPHRGKRNESKYIPLVAQKLAEVKGITIEEVAAITEENTQQLFGL